MNPLKFKLVKRWKLLVSLVCNILSFSLSANGEPKFITILGSIGIKGGIVLIWDRLLCKILLPA